jgi:hypothetical protein
MRPGERVDLMRRLADQVDGSGMPGADVEVMLRGFGFPAEGWDGGFDESLRTYVMRMIEQGQDEALVELDEYLLGGSSRDSLDPADLPWAAGTYKLFITHTHSHAALAGGVRNIFARWRIDAFVAHDTIEPTREW